MPKLIITETTKRTSFKIDGAPVVVNQEYDLSLQGTIEIENTYGYPSEPLDFYKYKIKDGDVLSTNEGDVLLSYKVDISTFPDEYDLIENLEINNSFKFSDLVPPANSFDRIKITDIQGKGIWLLNGIPIEINQVLFYYQIFDILEFVASGPGSKPDYNSLKWQFGHKLAFWPYENTINVNVSSLAEINLSDLNPPVEDEDPIDVVEYEANISNGPDSGTFKIEIDTTPFIGIGVAPENRVVVIINDVQTVYNTSGVFPLTGNLNESGSATIEVTIERLKPYTNASTISINLTEVNSLTDTINPSKDNIVLNNPITP